MQMARRTLSELDKELVEDVKNKVTAKPDQLTKIVAAATDLREQVRKIVKLEQLLEDAKVERRRLEWEVLPALMDSAGVQLLGLDNEDNIVREEDIFASISEKNLPKAVAWLDKNDLSSLVKTQFVIPIDKGDIKTRDRIAKGLEKAKIEYALKTDIHSQTLKAFVKESVANGRKLPKAISVHIQPAVHIRALKKQSRSK
jgi:hypothetical protein